MSASCRPVNFMVIAAVSTAAAVSMSAAAAAVRLAQRHYQALAVTCMSAWQGTGCHLIAGFAMLAAVRAAGYTCNLELLINKPKTCRATSPGHRPNCKPGCTAMGVFPQLVVGLWRPAQVQAVVAAAAGGPLTASGTGAPGVSRLRLEHQPGKPACWHLCNSHLYCSHQASALDAQVFTSAQQRRCYIGLC